jgi:hypothetical protein
VRCRNEVPGKQHLHDVPPVRRLVLGQFAVGVPGAHPDTNHRSKWTAATENQTEPLPIALPTGQSKLIIGFSRWPKAVVVLSSQSEGG